MKRGLGEIGCADRYSGNKGANLADGCTSRGTKKFINQMSPATLCGDK